MQEARASETVASRRLPTWSEIRRELFRGAGLGIG